MDDVVDRLRKGGTRIEDAWLRRMGTACFGHINFRGIVSFGVERYAQSLIRQAAASRRSAMSPG